MSKLTESQMQAKMRVESQGGVFIPPSKYLKGKKVKAPKVKYAVYDPSQQRQKKVNQYDQYSYTARAAVAPIRSMSSYQKLSADAAAIVDQVLDPETATSNIVRWPNTYGVSAVYPSKNVLSAKFAANNRSAIAVYPRLRKSIFATRGDSYAVILPENLNATTRPGTYSPYLSQDISISSFRDNPTDGLLVSEPFFITQDAVVVPVPHAGTNAMVYNFYGTSLSAAKTGIFFNTVFRFPGAYRESIQVTITRYDGAMNVIGNPQAYECDAEGIVSCTMWQDSNAWIGGQPFAFSYRITSNFTPYVGKFVATMTTSAINNDVVLQIPNTPYNMSYEDLKDTDTIMQSAEKYMILGQSLLLTPQMSDTKNGGTLAIGRVPGGSYVGLGSGGVTNDNWYDWIASLPTNNYDGPVKKGGYSFFLPDDERGFFYRDVNSFSDISLPYIVSEFTAPEDAGEDPVRIKVVTLVQMTTNSSVHSLRPSSVCPELRQIHHILSMVNAAYENETHKEQLKKHLKTIGNRVLEIVKNPDNWVKGASALSALLL